MGPCPIHQGDNVPIPGTGRTFSVIQQHGSCGGPDSSDEEPHEVSPHAEVHRCSEPRARPFQARRAERQ
jgi:hypothetical protein